MLATLRGEPIDVDWLGKTLRGEEIGGYIPRGHPNSLRVWEAVEYYSWGWSLLDVADAIRADIWTVRHWMQNAGVPRRPAEWKGRRLPAPVWQQTTWAGYDAPSKLSGGSA